MGFSTIILIILAIVIIVSTISNAYLKKKEKDNKEK